MRYTILALLLSVLLPAPLIAQEVDARYASCTTLTQKNPKEALKMAEKWAQADNVASAYHCRAIALFALKRYAEAGHALEELSHRMQSGNRVLWSNVLRQSAKAWELSGDKARAMVALTRAITPATDEALQNPAMARMAADLLLDRGLLYQSGKRPLHALQDLDHGLSLMPKHLELLLARATLLAEQNENELAQKDIETLLALSQRHAAGLKLKSQLQARSG